jgi:hypothetical protein
VASTWGSTALKILIGTLKPGATSANLTEVALLPDPAALSAISTVIQQAGRKRLRVKAKLYVSTVSAYNSFVDDYNAGTGRTLNIDDTGISDTYMIESLGDPDFVQYNLVEFDIVWLEV